MLILFPNTLLFCFFCYIELRINFTQTLLDKRRYCKAFEIIVFRNAFFGVSLQIKTDFFQFAKLDPVKKYKQKHRQTSVTCEENQSGLDFNMKCPSVTDEPTFLGHAASQT